MDTLSSLHKGTALSPDVLFKTARTLPNKQLMVRIMEVWVKSFVINMIPTAVLSSFGAQQGSRSADNVVLSDIYSTCLPIITNGVKMASSQLNLRETDVQTLTSTNLANNTRFLVLCCPYYVWYSPLFGRFLNLHDFM